MAKSRDDFEQELRSLLEELRPIALGHYHPLINGEIQTYEDLSAWARDFYVRDVGTVLARTYAKCPHLDARRFIAQNLMEEEGNFKPGRSHTELSRKFAKHFGTTDEEIEANYRARKDTPEASARRQGRPSEDWLEEFAGFGLGAEFFAPALFTKIIPRLRDDFGVPEEALGFFTVHLAEDAHHSSRTMEIVLKYATTEEEQHKVREAIKRWVVSGQPRAEGGQLRRLPEEVVRPHESRCAPSGEGAETAAPRRS